MGGCSKNAKFGLVVFNYPGWFCHAICFGKCLANFVHILTKNEKNHIKLLNKIGSFVIWVAQMLKIFD